MAEDDIIDDPMAEKAEKGSGRRWLLIGTLGFVLLLGGGIGGAWLLYPDQVGGLLGMEPTDGESEDRRAPIYYPLEQPFIVNLADDSRRLLQANIELMTRDPDSIAALERHEPVIRNDLLLLLSSKSVADLGTREGKEALRVEALEEVRGILAEQSDDAELEEVYFTSLVIQ